MTKYQIQPFYYPTTVIFVDDSADFLANLCLQLNSNLAFRRFHSPHDALIAINGSCVSSTSIDDFFSLYNSREDDLMGQHVINVSLGRIHREVHNDQRFEQVSVVVVDYDMPDMNGLEFCRGIHNPNIKKILLTGVADEKIAVQAFNEGIINSFIRKHDVDAVGILGNAIREMQNQYFGQLEQKLSDALSVGSHLFLSDSKFAQRVREIKVSLGIVEHYIVCEPEGLLMLDGEGRSYLLMVRTAEQYRADYEIAYDQNAPLDILNQLRRGVALPYFERDQDNFSPSYTENLPKMFAAEEFEGKHWYMYSVIDRPAAFNLKYVTSYNDFLTRLDDQVKALN